jgi:hypothetical protein
MPFRFEFDPNLVVTSLLTIAEAERAIHRAVAAGLVKEAAAHKLRGLLVRDGDIGAGKSHRRKRAHDPAEIFGFDRERDIRPGDAMPRQPMTVKARQ